MPLNPAGGGSIHLKRAGQRQGAGRAGLLFASVQGLNASHWEGAWRSGLLHGIRFVPIACYRRLELHERFPLQCIDSHAADTSAS